MLQGIRDKAQGWIAWTIILVVCVIFALWGIEHYLTGNNANAYAAKVDGIAITKMHLNGEYERVKRQRQMQLGADYAKTPENAAQLKQQILNQLVTSQVLVQAAINHGFRVTQHQIDAALSTIPAFLENNSFSAQKFNLVLSKLGYSENDFIGLLSSDILINQVQAGIIASAFALPLEVDNALRLTEQKRSVAYALIPMNQYIHANNISEATAQTYYNEHLKDFKTTEQVKIEYLKLSMDEIKSHIVISNAELEQYYKTNIESFNSPSQWQIAHILIAVPNSANDKEISLKKDKIDEIARQLQQNVDFAELAAKNSEDTATAKTGGIMPWFGAGTMKEEIYQKTVKILKPGMLSNPIKTSKGFEIIKLIAIKPGEVLPFDKAAEQIRKILLQQKAQQLFSTKSDKLANLTYSNPDSLQTAAAALDLKIENSDFFTRQGSKVGITSNPKVIASAFDADVLTRKNNSPVIEINPDTVVVLRVLQFQPVEVLPFTKVKPQIVEKLSIEQAKKKAKLIGEEIVQQLRSGKLTTIQLAKQYHLNWHTVDKMSRHDVKINPGILEIAFGLQRPKEKGIPHISGNSLASGDYAIVKIFAVYDGNTNLEPQQRQIFAEHLASSFGQLDYASYMKVQLKKAKIVYDTRGDSETVPVSTGTMDDE